MSLAHLPTELSLLVAEYLDPVDTYSLAFSNRKSWSALQFKIERSRLCAEKYSTLICDVHTDFSEDKLFLECGYWFVKKLIIQVSGLRRYTGGAAPGAVVDNWFAKSKAFSGSIDCYPLSVEHGNAILSHDYKAVLQKSDARTIRALLPILLPNLREMYCRPLRAVKESLRTYCFIPAFETLTYLSLKAPRFGCRADTITLYQWMCLPSLRSLSLDNWTIDEYPGRYSHNVDPENSILENLQLTNCHLTQQWMLLFQSLPQLKTLFVSSPDLRMIDYYGRTSHAVLVHLYNWQRETLTSLKLYELPGGQGSYPTPLHEQIVLNEFSNLKTVHLPTWEVFHGAFTRSVDGYVNCCHLDPAMKLSEFLPASLEELGLQECLEFTPEVQQVLDQGDPDLPNLQKIWRVDQETWEGVENEHLPRYPPGYIPPPEISDSVD